MLLRFLIRPDKLRLNCAFCKDEEATREVVVIKLGKQTVNPICETCLEAFQRLMKGESE